MNIKTLQKELAKKGYNIKLASEVIEEPKIKTGIFPLDYVLSGGIAQCEGGHRIEFWGSESCGKTTFALHIIKKYQELGKSCIFIDAEESYDATWAGLIGVDSSKLVVVKPHSLEEFGDMIPILIPEADLIVIDSIVSLIPEGEIDRDTNQPTMALQARINALITRKIYNSLTEKMTTMIFINQMREKVGVMYGSPNTSGGGRALKHMYNTRIEFKTGKPIEEGTGENKERVGYEINLRCIKNKKGRPYRQAVVDLYFDGKIDNTKALFYSGVKAGLITRSGAWYEYGEIRAQGKEKLIEELKVKDWEIIEEKVWKDIK